MILGFIGNRSTSQTFAAAALLGIAIFMFGQFAVSVTPAHAQACPWNCRVWLVDGCNTCSCNNGRIENCTKAGCRYPQAPGRCVDPPSALLDLPRNCKWFGTAPFCRGSCPPGYNQRIRSQRGDGKKCVSGSKVYCCTERRVSLTVNFCRAYAETAIAQHRMALDRGCSVSGPVWSQDFFHHINWCLMLASEQQALAGQRARSQFIQNGCR